MRRAPRPARVFTANPAALSSVVGAGWPPLPSMVRFHGLRGSAPARAGTVEQGAAHPRAGGHTGASAPRHGPERRSRKGASSPGTAASANSRASSRAASRTS